MRSINNRTKEQKEEEKYYTSLYIEKKYGFIPKFIDLPYDPPDCYFENRNKKIAVEATRYFQFDSEKSQHRRINDVNKMLKSGNFFEEVYKHFGKVKSESDIYIPFYNHKELTDFIVNNVKYIKCIEIDNNYFLNDCGDTTAEVICPESTKTKMTINEFMNIVDKYIIEGSNIQLDIFNKNKYRFSVNIFYSKCQLYGKNNDKRAIPLFCCFWNEEEIYNNIIKCIVEKNNKFNDNYKYKVDYDYYYLVIYYVGYPASVNEEELYKRIQLIQDINYNEIAIFLWGKIMVINNNGYMIYERG